MKKVITCLIVLVCLTTGAGVLLKQHKEKTVQATTTSPAVAVDVTSPTRETLHRVVEVFGSLSPKISTEVKSELMGRILRMKVKEWDLVKPKDVLADIDPVDLKVVLSRTEAGLKMARAQVLQAKVDLDRAKREWNRARKLKEGGLITGQDLDERQSGMESAEAKLVLAQAQVGEAEALVAEARVNLDKAVIRAPIQGVISRRSLDVGDFVDKGVHLFTIVDNRALDFTANVSATELPRVVEGQLLTFTVDGIPNRTFKGSVKRVNPMVSSTDRSGRILAEVENSDGALKGGLYARGLVMVEEHKDALALPKAALINWDMEKGTARVFVVDEGALAHSRQVTTGLAGDDLVEVKSGLTGAENVVLRGGFNIREGDRVEVIKAN